METKNKMKQAPLVIEAMAWVSMGALGMALAFSSTLVAWSTWQNVGPSQLLLMLWAINIIGFVASYFIYYREVR